MAKYNKEWLEGAISRAIWTIAQTALSYMAIGMGFTDIDWVKLASVAGVAGVISFLKSCILGVPEAATDGTLMIDESDPEKSLYMLNVETPLDKVATMKSIRLVVDPNAKIDKE